MSTSPVGNWVEENQRGLVSELACIRAALARHAMRAEPTPASHGDIAPEQSDELREPDARSSDSQRGSAPALESLCAIFSLSPFERDVLLLCAGVDLSSLFPEQCAAAHGDPRKRYPTFSLALAALREPHWSALLPVAPLRRWQLVEPGTRDSITTSPLRIDERILHYLTGVSYLDERLHGLVEPIVSSADLPPSHDNIAEQIVQIWRTSGVASGVQLFGSDARVCRDIAAVTCARLGLQLYAARASEIPSVASERETFIRLWQRETLLGNCALLLDCNHVGDEHALAALMERLPTPLIIVAREPLTNLRTAPIKFEVRKPAVAEQQLIWRDALGPVAAAQLNGQLELVSSHFDLDAHSIRAAGAELSGRLFAAETAEPEAMLWNICRSQARRHLEGLARRIEPVATWDDLVLPEPQRQILREIALHVRHRSTVYERWGFARKASRGLGISALFTGASGTGKTLAAEVLANELQLDLICVDASRCRSKWLGETEKNLAHIFDAAECSGAILLFDEADCFFGKRTEVKDSHDRYANVEVSYLLQRMESYRGLAILTTNMKAALDSAFLRRIRFVIQFPFPDPVQRAEIWRRIFPRETPTDGLDLDRLARLNVAGGNIRNIALHAAFLAADSQDPAEPVRMSHLLRSARTEYAKIEKPLSESEIGGWK